MNVAEVNIPVAVLIWLMIVPMLLKVDFAALHRCRRQWRGIAVTVGINWLVKPFSMALLGWLFIGVLFRPFLPAAQIDSYIAGLILLAAAPCTAMVFVWSSLTDGDPNFTLIAGRAERHDHGVRLRADRRPAARACPRSPCRGNAVPVGRALHRHPGDRGAAVAARAAGAAAARRRWPRMLRRLAAGVARGAARDPGPAVRLPGRADRAPAAGDRCCSRCRS